MQLSKAEFKAFETLRKSKLEVFRIRDISLLLDTNKASAYNIVKALKNKKAIEILKNGVFALKGTDEFLIATSLNWPSYISFWTALNYYGFSDNMPKIIFLASTRYHKQVKSFKYVTISKQRFFGYLNINGIIIAEKEKAIIDSLMLPKYSGGISEIKKCLQVALKKIDISKLITYALKISSKSVIRRLGFLLEGFEIKENKLKLLLKNIGNGYELLDPALKKKNNLNKKWLLDINV